MTVGGRLADVSTRRYFGAEEPVGEEVERSAGAMSKSSVSEAFNERTRTALGELMERRLEGRFRNRGGGSTFARVAPEGPLAQQPLPDERHR